MNFLRIAARIAEEQVSYNPDLLKFITPEIRGEFNISEDSKPFEEGLNSVVYINDAGNIVAFSFDDRLTNVAKRIKGDRVSVLPEIYRFDVIPIDFHQMSIKEMSVVEMEKLASSLNKEETEASFTIGSILCYWMRLGVRTDDDSVGNMIRAIREEGVYYEGVEGFIEEVLDLYNRAYNLGVKQMDFHGGNIMRDASGNLKFIDLDSIKISDEVPGLVYAQSG